MRRDLECRLIISTRRVQRTNDALEAEREAFTFVSSPQLNRPNGSFVVFFSLLYLRFSFRHVGRTTATATNRIQCICESVWITTKRMRIARLREM